MALENNRSSLTSAVTLERQTETRSGWNAV